MLLKDLITALFKVNIIPGKVYFRVDAGKVKGLSFGHISRCHILSKALRKYWNIETIFLMQDYADGIKHVNAIGETVKVVKVDDLGWIKNLSDTVVFDLPNGPGTDELAIAKRLGLWTIIFDDTNSNIPWANVVLNSSILAQSANYPKEAQLLLGSEYFISDEQFEAVQRKVRRQNDLFSVLITFGGSDPTGLILKVLKTLAKSTYPEFVFKIVLGPGFTEEEDVDDIVACFPSMIEVFKNPPDLLPLFIDCDLAICSGGRTLYELNTLKVPTLAIASIEHEAPVINAFLAQKKLMAGLWAWDEQEFIKQLEISLGRIAKQGNDVFSNNCN